MKKQVILLTIFIFNCVILYSQDYPPKKQLKKLFSKKQIYLGEFSWEGCNNDSAYFKNDTIKLYFRNTSFYKTNPCCEYIFWTFHNSRTLQIGKLRLSQEPPISSLSLAENPYAIKYKKHADKLELQIVSRDNQIERFLVEHLIRCKNENMEDCEFNYQLTLIRMK